MELVGIVDLAPTLSLRALSEIGMPYDLYIVDPKRKREFDEAGIPVAGSFEDLLQKVDIALDAAPAGGEKNEVADVFFHGYANYEKGVGQDYLKLTSCNTTGFVRAIDALDRLAGVKKVIITIIRRVADPGDTHRGYVDLLRIEPVPNHQCVDLMKIMPHIHATGLLVHTPVTHGHIINIVATPKRPITKDELLDTFRAHPRIRVVRIADGFNSNTSLFKYARDLGNKRGDMYEIAVWEECIGFSGDDVMFAINIPQEAVTIPETMDGIRASLGMQTDRLEAVGLTNRYLGLKPGL